MKRSLPYVLFGALTLVCFWKFLFLGWTLYDVRTLEEHLGTRRAEPGWFEVHRPRDRGDTLLSLPMLHRIYGDGLHHGELRLWNPYLFCGYPLYNNLLVHPFYPPNLVLFAILPPRVAYDLNLLLHFFFAGAAMYRLLRGLGRSEAASTAGGLLWMLFGYSTLWFSSGTTMGASVFAPLALLGITRGLETRTLKPFALGGGAMGMVILGSHGQHAMHLLIFFSFWLLVCLIRTPETRPLVLRGGLSFGGVALGVGLAAILTQLDSVMNGFRVPGGDAELHYASPWTLFTYLAGAAIGKVHGPTDDLLRSEFTIYVGAAGTCLAVAGAVRGWREPWTRFAAIFGGIALLVAFVKPLALLALQIPFLNLSMPARWVYVFGFCVAPLAARGFDALQENPGRFPRSLIAGAVAVLILCVAGIGSVRVSQALAIETLAGLALAVAAALTIRSAPKLSLALCFAALLVDLLPDFVLFNRPADPRPLDETLRAVEVARGRESEPWRATGSLRRETADPAPANGWTVSVGSNLLALQGVEAVMGYESIAPLPIVDFCVLNGGPQSVMGSGRVLAVFPPLGSKLLALANMKYVFMPFAYDPEPPLRKIGSWGPLVLYENRDALPRAFLVNRVRAAPDPSGVANLMRDFDPRTTAVLESAQVPRVAESAEGTVAWKVRSTDRIELEVSAKSDAVLVLSETDYPGWEAELDGAAAPIYRADLAFRAVAVPAGTHRLTMRFRPSSVRAGLAVTLLSIVGLAAFSLWRKKKSS